MFKEFPDDDRRADDFLNEFRQRISDQSLESLEEKREELRRSKSVFLGIAGGVTLAGIVGWLILAPQYRVENEKEIPVIRRPQTAIRVQPNEPGGMDIPNQDKSVYNIIEKKTDTTVENLLPPPEDPKLPVIAAPQEDIPPVLAEAEKIVQNATPAAPSEETLKQAEQAAAAPQPVKEEPKAQEPAQKKNVEQPKPAPAPTPAPQPEAKAQPQTTPAAAATGGDWQIQLMSSPNKAAVEKAKVDLGNKYKISQLPFEIESAVLDQNKIFYRLKVGAFKTRADADKLCNDIKNLGGTCIVKKK